MIDIHNKTVVVTGANSGVGFVTPSGSPKRERRS
jgi:NADP-dependent 3-hydroxy acid dehydrogenase YdfG